MFNEYILKYIIKASTLTFKWPPAALNAFQQAGLLFDKSEFKASSLVFFLPNLCEYLFLCLAECRILQYGQMSMSSEATGGDQRVTKAYVEAVGDQGLLNLLTDDTVFFVGGYPKTFKVGRVGGGGGSNYI